MVGSRACQPRLSPSRALPTRCRDREEAGLGAKGVPLPVKVVYKVLCLFLDLLFYERPIQRFWFLETVARMPYFSYTSMLHLYESLGWWRAGSELRKGEQSARLSQAEQGPCVHRSAYQDCDCDAHPSHEIASTNSSLPIPVVSSPQCTSRRTGTNSSTWPSCE